MANIAYNIRTIRTQITNLAYKHGRNPEDITLVGVSKTKSIEQIRKAYQAGIYHFGENYVQEAINKIHQIKEPGITWHFIGPIQSNKTRLIAQHFSWVHTIDRFKIAQRLSSQKDSNQSPLNVCIQINISQNPAKNGILPNERQTLTSLADSIIELPGLKLKGLMCIPDYAASYQKQLETFEAMLSLYKSILLKKQSNENAMIDTLSMGMSQDLEAAIQAGSTMLRIGTNIFGPR